MSNHIEAMTVGEIMTRNPVTVHPKTSLGDLKNLFEQYDYNTIPVVDEKGILRGTVTKLDLLRMFRPDRTRIIPDFSALHAERVEDIMGRGFVDVVETDPVVRAVDMMIDLNLRSIPIIQRTKEGRLLTGIVSRKDVLRCFVFESGEKK